MKFPNDFINIGNWMEKISLQNHPHWNFLNVNNRYFIPIGISIEIFIPLTKEKSSIGELRQGCASRILL